jgi:hypothetical protein
MRAPVIRISLGFFDADKAGLVERKLAETRERLEPGIRALPRLLRRRRPIEQRNA